MYRFSPLQGEGILGGFFLEIGRMIHEVLISKQLETRVRHLMLATFAAIQVVGHHSQLSLNL